MGILKNREELLPVTCAILKDEERDHFFTAAKKKVGGNMERIAQICDVAVSAVSDWINGKSHIPYHTLQRMAQELEVEMPAVGELRREYQLVATAPRPRVQAKPADENWETNQPSSRRERPKRVAKAPRPKRPRVAKTSRPKAQAPAKPAVPEAPAKPSGQQGLPKLCDKLAYWSGVVIAAARYEEKSVILSADRRMGQNFASTWANLTAELFGVKPALSMSADRKTQRAELPTAGLEAFLTRMDFKPETASGERPGAPRWAWSNQEWKAAFVRGVVDACAYFHRTPTLNLASLSPRLSQALQKMLASLGFSPKVGADHALLLEGKQEVEKYFDSINTWNMKLKDQFRAYRPAVSLAEAPAQPQTEERTPPQDAAKPGETPAAEAPTPKPRSRTRYRGRPGRRNA